MVEASTLGLATAFAAGVVSFLSPCVLPLVPAYVSYVAGERTRRTTSPRPAKGGGFFEHSDLLAGFHVAASRSGQITTWKKPI